MATPTASARRALNSSDAHAFSAFVDALVPGYCGKTNSSVLGDCEEGESGDLKTAMRLKGGAVWSSWHTLAKACLKACSGCAGCRYVTMSLRHRDCSWYRVCQFDSLLTRPAGFRTAAAPQAVLVRSEQITRPVHDACSDGCLNKYDVLPPSAWRVGFVHIPKCGGSSVLHSLGAADVPACNVMTAGAEEVCTCRWGQTGCLKRVAVVAGERPQADLVRRPALQKHRPPPVRYPAESTSGWLRRSGTWRRRAPTAGFGRLLCGNRAAGSSQPSRSGAQARALAPSRSAASRAPPRPTSCARAGGRRCRVGHTTTRT